MVEELCRCGKKLTWVPQYSRYYCYRCRQYPPRCPYCNRDLFWVPKYGRYYCNTCRRYVEPKPAAPPTPAQATPLHAPAPPQLAEMYTPEQAMTMFRHLKERYESGVLGGEEYENMLKTFKFLDNSGKTWTIGAQSEMWYYHDGKTWVKGIPPPKLQRLSA